MLFELKFEKNDTFRDGCIEEFGIFLHYFKLLCYEV